VLGVEDWQLLQSLRRYGRPVAAGIIVLLVVVLGLAIFEPSFTTRFLAIESITIMAVVSIWSWWLLKKRGIFDPAHFSEVFNRVLRSRVEKIYREAGKATDQIPDKIRFRDIDVRQVNRFCRLKVVATDISGQQLRLFDHRTPDVVIAEAVAASIAIPAIFKPARIPSFTDSEMLTSEIRYYADGGLVSSLPVWCFAEEKAATERRRMNSAAVPIVAFALGDAGAARGAILSSLAYFSQVLRTAIFGGQIVVQDFVNDLCAIQLQCPLGVLAFDATWEEAKNAHDMAKQQALSGLTRRLVVEPKEWERVLTAACTDISSAIKSHLQAAGREATNLRLRASVFEPIRSLRHHAMANFITAYRVTRSFNMESDADDRLTLDAESPGVPEAFEDRNLILWGPAEPSRRQAKMTKYERALVRRSVKSAICIPIFADVEQWNSPPASRNQPLAVAAFDTDEAIIALLQGSESVLARITEATFGLGPLLRERGPE
jgi:predicted acylesterase/phospholipase RssA